MVKARAMPIGLLVLGAVCAAYRKEADADRDGLSDQFEQALLQKFAPRFHISATDCDIAPAEFHPDLPQPRVKARNGTIYGQVFPLQRGSGARRICRDSLLPFVGSGLRPHQTGIALSLVRALSL